MNKIAEQMPILIKTYTTNTITITKPLSLLQNPPVIQQIPYELDIYNISSKLYFLMNFIINYIKPSPGNYVSSADLFDGLGSSSYA